MWYRKYVLWLLLLMSDRTLFCAKFDQMKILFPLDQRIKPFYDYNNSMAGFQGHCSTKTLNNWYWQFNRSYSVFAKGSSLILPLKKRNSGNSGIGLHFNRSLIRCLFFSHFATDSIKNTRIITKVLILFSFES